MQKPAKPTRAATAPEALPGIAPAWSNSAAETIWVLIVSGFLGAAIALAYAEWQVAVESAQVLAGTVQYPYESSFHTYHVKTWTLMNQVPAILLAMGMSTESVSLLVAAATGMLGFQALALVALALGANRYLGLTAPILFVAIAGHWGFTAAVYPLILVGTPDTYGVLALNWVLLGLALMGRGHLRAAWFCLALAPAFHIALGGWGILAAGLGTLIARVPIASTLKAVWPWIAAAAALTIASFAWQGTMRGDIPAVTPEQREQFIGITVALGDVHRQVVPPWHAGIVVNLAMIVVAGLWMFPFAQDVPERSRLLLAALAVSAALASIACWLTPLQEQLPRFFLRAMPGRYVNLVALAMPAVTIGLVGAFWSQLAVRASWTFGIALIVAGLLDSSVGLSWVVCLGCLALLAALRTLDAARLGAVLELVTYVSLFVLAAMRLHATWPIAAIFVLVAGELLVRMFAVAESLKRPVLAGAMIAAALVGLFAIRLNWRDGLQNMQLDIALREAAAGKGMLLTGSDLSSIQLQTGRPVLFCGGAVDLLPYVPEAGPDAQRVLAEVYGIDLFAPNTTQQVMYGNRLLPTAGQDAWQNRTVAEWSAIGKKYQATDVLVYKDWNLKLPLVSESDEYRLYHIPPAGAAPPPATPSS